LSPELIINEGAKLSKPLENSSFIITRYPVEKPLGVDNLKVITPMIRPVKPPAIAIDPRFIL
jgi:hypothetical protein